ncbi:retron St85 family RNA-directed DNA polymerase [Reyranella sp.]|uniref:retron St85 family RNA-directed DNA polymerase n=1 Tax=Reyranella sp. TaxID=1929291 RepID=UPI003D0BF2C1
MSELLRFLSADTGLPVSDLLRIINTAPRRYKIFFIPKRSGGMREIAQPARELKLLQRAVVTRLISQLPVHAAARAYRSGLSIKDNALPHAGGGPILKMDFRDFFPSIKSDDWERYCKKNNLLSIDDLNISSLILFRRVKGKKALRLSIGAPSSPALSNVLMFDFDTRVSAEAERRKINYTRYADDLTFSGQRAGMLRDMVSEVAKAVRQIEFPRLQVNDDKTTFITPSRRRTVTGVTLTNDGNLSLGRDRKRLISSKVHHASLGKLSTEELREAAGQLAFANVVEPEFVARLERRYGEIVSQIRKVSRSSGSS